MNDFIDFLKNYKKDNDLSMEQLATLIGVKRRALNYWFVGEKLPIAEKVDDIKTKLSTFKFINGLIEELPEDLGLYGVNAECCIFLDSKNRFLNYSDIEDKLQYIDEKRYTSYYFLLLQNLIRVRFNLSSKQSILKAIRLTCGLSPAEFAKKNKLSLNEIEAYENGEFDPSEELLRKNAKAIGLNDEILQNAIKFGFIYF